MHGFHQLCHLNRAVISEVGRFILGKGKWKNIGKSTNYKYDIKTCFSYLSWPSFPSPTTTL